jgi:hypothetical protein
LAESIGEGWPACVDTPLGNTGQNRAETEQKSFHDPSWPEQSKAANRLRTRMRHKHRFRYQSMGLVEM